MLSGSDWLLLGGALLVLVLVGRAWIWTARRVSVGRLGQALVPFLVLAGLAVVVALYAMGHR